MLTFNTGYNNGSGGLFQTVQPADNVARWILQNANEQLSMLCQNRVLDVPTAKEILARLNRNIKYFVNNLAQQTGNFTQNMTQDDLVNFVASVLQFIMDDLQNQLRQREAMQSNMLTSQLYNGAFAESRNASSEDLFNLIDRTPDLNETVQPAFGARIRTPSYMKDVNPQVQKYATAVGNAPIPAPAASDDQPDPTVYLRKRQQLAEILEKDTHPVMETTKADDAPISIRKDRSAVPFNPEDKTTWPIGLVTRYMEIDASNLKPEIKEYQASIAINEEYWKSKDITWSYDGGLEVSLLGDAKREARKQLANKSYQITNKQGYTINLDGKPLFADDKDIEVESVRVISELTNGSPSNTIAYARLSYEHVVPDEFSFIDQLTDGRLKDFTLTHKSEADIQMDKEGMTLALSVEYEGVSGIDVPHSLMSDYYEMFQKTSMRYANRISKDKDVACCEEFIKETINLLNDIPRRWSEKIDSYICDNLNECFSRTVIDITKGVPRPPHITEFRQVKDLLKNNTKRNAAYSETYATKLKLIVYQALSTLFGGSVLDPDQDDQLLTIVDGATLQNFIKFYYGQTISSDEVAEWIAASKKEPTEEARATDEENEGDPKEKLIQLREQLKKFTTVTAVKSLLITDAYPKYRGKPNGVEVNYVLADNHIETFEMLIANEYDFGGVIKDCVIVNNEYHWLKNPTALYKFYKTMDNYVGYSLI